MRPEPLSERLPAQSMTSLPSSFQSVRGGIQSSKSRTISLGRQSLTPFLVQTIAAFTKVRSSSIAAVHHASAHHAPITLPLS